VPGALRRLADMRRKTHRPTVTTARPTTAGHPGRLQVRASGPRGRSSLNRGPAGRAAGLMGTAALLVAGCASGGVDDAGGSSPSRSAGSSAAVPARSASAAPSTRSAHGSVTPPRSIGSAPSDETATLQIDETANGRSIELYVGQQLVVRLAAGWTAPAATTAPDVTATLQPLRSDTAVGFPAAGPASARFTAVRTGTATISARTDYACLHTTPRCALPQRLFSVAVRVRPRPGQGGGPLPKPAGS